MHLFDKNVNFLGSVVILGSGPSIASGIAMARKLDKKKSIVVVFIGDGSAEEGCFYETVNMAGLYKLPLLIVIEDNKYAVESNEKKRKVKKYNFEKIFKFGLNAEYMRVNGNDFEKVYKSTKILRRNILTKNKIGILHLDCIRHAKHSGANVSADDQKSKYRKRGEFNQIKKFDPIKILSKKLISIGFDLRKIEHLEKEIKIKAENIFYETIKSIKLRSI